MFEKILIANRAEIACRIARTCRRLGIRTVAVYSEPDRRARHVELADEAHLLGPAPALESYLNGKRILEIARRSGAEAIHPGYGFLAENPAFAEACAAAGLVFVGPPAEAIRAMGSKSAAKAIMERAGVPLVPGYHGEEQDPARLAEAAQAIGWPVLIKASAGGGGKGMRVVERPEAFADALAAARREASGAFGDDRMLVEKYLSRPRHIEIQVLGDRHGNLVHLFERDCSIQRRHQKIVEEAPAPGLTEDARNSIGEVAIAAARAVGYQNAGTVEFIVEGDRFYFLEMNTRLQVEHPVTEMITGQDLVEWQLKVAAGEPLACRQADLTVHGHAIEVRIYAEDPAREFLPSTGSLQHLRTPEPGPHVRIESGVRQGDAVGIHYDPMLAKLIVWDQDRPRALNRLRAALAGYEVVGVTTNLELLTAIAAHPAFAGGKLDTGFVERHRAELLPPPIPAPDRVLGIAALSELLRIAREAELEAARSADPHSPWHRASGWRLNDDNHHTLTLGEGAREVEVTAHYRSDHFLLELPESAIRASGELSEGGRLRFDLDGEQGTASVVRTGAELTVFSAFGRHRVRVKDRLHAAMPEEVASGRLTAPMPGNIIAVLVEAGARVAAGAPLLILEAMKMEHTISAPIAGVVERLNFAVGDQVVEGAELLAIKELPQIVSPDAEPGRS
jgi:3-methylcrotonyl-CoA carboxylase alpha subunit